MTGQRWVEKGGFYLGLLSVVTESAESRLAADSRFYLLELKILGKKIMYIYTHIYKYTHILYIFLYKYISIF